MRMRLALPLILAAVALAPVSEARACSCFGAPWLTWPETELPADQAMVFDSCWETSFLENLRVTVDGVAAELEVVGELTGNRYLGLRVTPAPTAGQTIVLEACDVDCGDPGDWTEQSTLTVVAPLGLAAPEPIVGGDLTYAHGSWEPECGVVEFRVDLAFDVVAASNVMYQVDVGLDGEAPAYTDYLRVLDDGGVTLRAVTEYFVDEASLGVPPEDLCATVTVHDFGGGFSDPVKICGSTEEPGGTGGDPGGSSSGTGGGSSSGNDSDSDGGTDSGGTGDSGDVTSGGTSGGIDGDGSGCSCTARDRRPVWALGLPLLVLGLRRRR